MPFLVPFAFLVAAVAARSMLHAAPAVTPALDACPLIGDVPACGVSIFFSLSLPAQRLSRLELRASKLPLSTLRMLYLPNNSTIRLDASPRRLALLVVTIRSMFTASVRLRLRYAHLLQTASWDPVALRRPHL